MPSQDDIKHQQDLLRIYRRNLAHLLGQASQFGGEKSAPLHIFNGIQEARDNIKRIKGILRGWGISVEDQADDGDKSPPTSSTTVPPQKATSPSAASSTTGEPRAASGMPTSARQLRAFLCHSSGDKPAVRDLYRRLLAERVEPWLDEKDLLPGQDWDLEIRRAIRKSDVVLVCLSSASISKAGYLQKELRRVLDVADEQPEGTIFVIPVKLEECEVPDRLSAWHWVNLFEEGGFERLMRALRARANEIGATIGSTT